jgi:hypothetical protein
VLLAACGDSGGSSGCKHDAVWEYGIDWDGKSKLEYWQYPDDPADGYTIGRLALLRDALKNPSASVYVLAPVVAALGYSLLLQGNPTIVQGIDPDGGSSPRDYVLLSPGALLEWFILRTLAFNYLYGVRHALTFAFYTAVPQNLTEAATLLLGTRRFLVSVSELLPNPGLIDLQGVLDRIDAQLAGLVFAAMLYHSLRLPVDLSDGLQRKVSSREADIFRYGVLPVLLTQLMLDNLNANFPDGVGPYGITARASPSLPLLAAGYVLLFWQIRLQALNLDGAGLAQATPLNLYQLGLVVDRNDDPSDNFLASAAFPKDFYDNTDRWMNATLDSSGLALQFIDATAGANPMVMASSAMAIQSSHVTLYIVNASEVTDSAAMPPVPPPFRATFFRHTGDFGAAGDWDADTAPFVDEPLARAP